MEFHLYDEHKEMSLYDFCRICLVPFGGKIEEPHRADVEGFIDTIRMTLSSKPDSYSRAVIWNSSK